jgi:lipid-binding SYLF domain-containing protein
MIDNADRILDRVISKNKKGKTAVPKGLFKKAKGIVIISSFEAGVLFGGHSGNGIIIAKDDNGNWSPPSAIGLTGFECGPLIGASWKDTVIFLFDDIAVETLAGEVGAMFGAQGELTIPSFGRAADLSASFSDFGVGSTFALAHTKGLFAGLSLNGAVLRCCKKANEDFYQKSISARLILFEGAVQVPNETALQSVYQKLNMIAEENEPLPVGQENSESNLHPGSESFLDDLPVDKKCLAELPIMRHRKEEHKGVRKNRTRTK